MKKSSVREKKTVIFRFFTGIPRRIFRRPMLVGSWNKQGEYSEWWTQFSMEESIHTDGCPYFYLSIQFLWDPKSPSYKWGVIFNGPTGDNQWGIPTEIVDSTSHDCYQTFHLFKSASEIQYEDFYFTNCCRLGARKNYPPKSDSMQQSPGITFAVWAPNAQKVDLVFGNPKSGYIADDGSGMDKNLGPFPMVRDQQGVWSTDSQNPQFQNFERFLNKTYMYRITKENGHVAYRTDLYSYEQIGKGDFDPKGLSFAGTPQELDGTKSCSLVVDIDKINPHFGCIDEHSSQTMSEQDFWNTEFQAENILPKKIEDLVIYELHIAALGAGDDHPGHFLDAMILLPYLKELGINAVELLPIMEFEGAANWGYGTSHFFAVESSAGGRDQLKCFIRECHRQGIAVIVDVVFNHYHHRAERAQLHYDSDDPRHDIYYWYQGNPSDYPDPEFGYIDNMSTGFAPRFNEEMVRKLFISSAVMLVENFHIDGFRVDQTTSMHSYNVLHGNGSHQGIVNQYGAKFLREFTRTLKMINPNVILIAEDHSEWPMVTEAPIRGGLGFDATWYAKFYHDLIGGQGFDGNYARLLRFAGYGDDRELMMDKFAETLISTKLKRVVYHESHDEAGNSQNSARTIEIAINHASLTPLTRLYAENRSRIVAAINLFSAGTPMFFMGEEVCARKDYTYFTFMQNREDLLRERSLDGSAMFVFYQDIIHFRHTHSAFRSHNIEVLYVHNQNRILAFRRWDEYGEYLVIMSLNNVAFTDGYIISNPVFSSGLWREVFNSDSKIYHGNNIGNNSALIPVQNNALEIIIPANAVLVFRKQM